MRGGHMFKYRIDRIPKPAEMPDTISGSATLLHSGNEYRHMEKIFSTYSPKQGEIIVFSAWYKELQEYRMHHWTLP